MVAHEELKITTDFSLMSKTGKYSLEPPPLTAKLLKDFVKLESHPNKNMRQLMITTAHVLLLIISDLDTNLVRLKTNKSDLADKQWLSGIKPAFSNASKIINLCKQAKFNSS